MRTLGVFKKGRKGQSTVEYIVLVTAVLGALIIFLGPKGIFRGTMDETYERGASSLNEMSKRLSDSRPGDTSDDKE